MASFSITPVAEFPPADADDFPNYIQFLANGVALGGPDVDTVNFGPGLTATRGTGEAQSAIELRVPLLAWRESYTDTTLTLADASNGIAMLASSGETFVSIPADTGDALVDLADGDSVLVFQEGVARITVIAESGVQIMYRKELFPSLAGQYATATLIKRAPNTWILCGDLEFA